MPKFIECKWTSDKNIWIAVDKIVAVLSKKDGEGKVIGTYIWTAAGEDDNFLVDDIPEVILQKLGIT